MELVVLPGVAAVAALWYGLFVLPTQWLKVERVVWRRDWQTKVLQISDVHIERNRVVEPVLRFIQQEKPDYIFLTGDYLDSPAALPKLQSFLQRLASFGIPTFAVLGNHDYLLEDLGPLTQLLTSVRIRLLRNESVSLPEFELIGIDDFCTEHADIEAAFSRVEGGRRRFVITHDPNIVLHLEHPYDTLISGHLHGKQFNVPFLFKLTPMGPLAAQGIYKGRHKAPCGGYYISKGAGQSGYNYRLFVRSEVTLHYI